MLFTHPIASRVGVGPEGPCPPRERGQRMAEGQGPSSRAKLQDKARWRPTAMVMIHEEAPVGDEASDDEYCQVVKRVATA